MNVHRAVENVYIRQEAVQLTRRNFWRLLGMGAIVFCCTTSTSDSLRHIFDAFPISDPLIASFFSILGSLLGMCISASFLLGYRYQLLIVGRGGIPRVWGVLGRLRYWLKALGLALLMNLKTTLWAAPGCLVCLLGAELPLYGLDAVGELVHFLGIVTILWLAMPAALSYAMAPYILADEPDRGVRECIEYSKGLMTGRRWQAFKLGLPPLLITLGILLTVFWLLMFYLGLALSVTIPEYVDLIVVVALLLLALSSVYFILQLDMVYTLFYLHTRKPITPDGAPQPVSYWLRDHREPDSERYVPSPAVTEAEQAPDPLSSANKRPPKVQP